MPTQILYDANIDFDATCDRVFQHSENATEIPFYAYQTEKGLLRLTFKKSSVIFLISHRGKILVSWERADQKRILLKEIRKLLVPVHEEKLNIKPVWQQVRIPYPTPPNFRLYWCDEKTEYVERDPLLELLSALDEYFENAPTQ